MLCSTRSELAILAGNDPDHQLTAQSVWELLKLTEMTDVSHFSRVTLYWYALSAAVKFNNMIYLGWLDHTHRSGDPHQYFYTGLKWSESVWNMQFQMIPDGFRGFSCQLVRWNFWRFRRVFNVQLVSSGHLNTTWHLCYIYKKHVWNWNTYTHPITSV